MRVAFCVPAVWLTLFAAAHALQRTSWGRDGHPSNGVIVLLAVLAAAIPAGITAGAWALMHRRRVSWPVWMAATLLNACVTAAGIYHLAG